MASHSFSFSFLNTFHAFSSALFAESYLMGLFERFHSVTDSSITRARTRKEIDWKKLRFICRSSTWRFRNTSNYYCCGSSALDRLAFQQISNILWLSHRSKDPSIVPSFASEPASTIFGQIVRRTSLCSLPSWGFHSGFQGLFLICLMVGESWLVILYSSACQQVLPLENDMKQREKFPKTLCAGMLVTCALYMLMGILGMLAFRQPLGSITLDLPHEGIPGNM